MSFHSNLSGLDIHTMVAFTYANAAARTGALGLVIGDVGKVAQQTDDGSFWILVSASPVTWAGFGGDSMALTIADQALLIAEAGTNAAASAFAYAGQAWSIAVAGTTAAHAADSWARDAFSLAVTGTNAANQVNTTAVTALNTSWVGTNAANQAYTLAGEAYTLAVAGTTSGVGVFLPLAGGVMIGTMTVPNVQVGVGTTSYFSNSNGTIAYDFTGPAYQQTTVNGALRVSASNPGPGREIAIVFIADGTSRNLTYDTNFEFYGATPPSTISTKNVLIALTSLTSNLSGVIGAASTGL